MIPDAWEVKRLGDLATVRDGTHQTPRYVPDGIPFYSVEHVTCGDFTRTKFISDEEHRFLTRSYKIERGDILMTRIGSIGDCRLVDWDVNASFYVSLALLKLHGADAAFVTQYSNSQAFKAEVDLHSLPSATPKKINLGPISDIRLPIPPLPEQRAIAAALSDVDALLGGLERLIAKKRDLKQAAMQQLLTGQTRLPGFSGEWEILQIREIASVRTGPFGSTLHESDYVQDGTPIITVEHLGEFGVTRQNLPLVSDQDCKRLCSYALEAGDIVFSRVGSIDRNALIREEEEGWLFSGRLLRVRPDKKRVFAPYLSLQFHTESFKNSVLAVAVGQTMASLNTKILRDLSVPIPSIGEQDAIATVLSDMDAELSALEARRDKTRALKQAMMQELLTGRIRLISGELKVESGE
ncbi:MAG TPA: restriction endonuclease subunit S [Candidatus Accumulibacter phosphatis]|nr:restriction endonuclease subunit S [Candidatus Accumulibacter phosphatis]HRQ96973.1 restriction endonuclease subunit S [Candidatus Accumulibacter phosphatis]